MDERRSFCFIWIFTVLGTGCLLASCATKYWQQNKTLKEVHLGLWQTCGGSSCTKFNVYDKYNGKDMFFLHCILRKSLKNISQQWGCKCDFLSPSICQKWIKE